MKFRSIWRLSFCFVLSFWLFKELLKKILKKILNALVIPRIFLICAIVTLMDFRYSKLVENQSNNFDDFLHLEALEKIINFSNCFWQVCCPGYAYCCEGGRNCCVKKEHPMLRFFPTGKVTPKIEAVKQWIWNIE